MKPTARAGAVAVTAVACLLLPACSTSAGSALSTSVPPSTTTIGLPSRVPMPAVQLGIDIDFYATPGTNISASAQDDIAYVKHLDANAVSISFPYYTNRAGTVVHALPKTPAPSQLTTLIVAAERADLAVILRPLLNEASLGTSRPGWEPTSLANWFTAYRQFLLPYARLAQADDVTMFVIGAEFSRFNQAPQWAALAAAVSQVYHGTVGYSNNWDTARNRAPDVEQLLDAYQPIQLPTTASLPALEDAWSAWTRRLPTGLVLSEVGVDPQPGAFTRPWRRGQPGQPIIPDIQVKWFTAACHSVAVEHLGGVYFWPLYFGQSLTTPLGTKDPTAFAGTAGATAIAQCFTTLQDLK